MNDNLFDLNNLIDIPKEIKKDLNSDEYAKRIIELFNIAKRPLSVDEITVGYFRKFNMSEEDSEQKTKRQLNVKLYNMSREKKPLIEAVKGKKGIYKLIETKE